MKRLLGTGAAVALVMLLYGIRNELASEALVSTRIPVRLVSISDGDTVRLKIPGYSDQRFRLGTVDAPETDQPFGRESTRCLRNALRGKPLTVRIGKKDSYGRLVGNVYSNGERVDVLLVSKGCAWWYRRYAPTSLVLMRAQLAAKRRGIGLWQNRNPIEPESWRRGER
ncbi:MAG: thermonuclease family protein [Pseudomonadota bacterium]